MPEIEINVVGARGDQPNLHREAFADTTPDNAQRESANMDTVDGESENKDESAPGTLEWKER